MRAAYAVLKRELSSYFGTYAVYLVLGGALLLSGYFFYTDLVFFMWHNVAGTSNRMAGLWQYYLSDLRLVLTLAVPVLTMRLLSEEKRQGTLELLDAYPVREWEILAGKFVATFAVLAVLLACTFLYPILVGLLWDFEDLNALLGGYLGITLLGCSFVCCGVFISTLTDNQLVAGMSTLGVLTLFWFLTWNELVASNELISVLRSLSLFDRTEAFFKGLVETEDVAFFLLLSLFFLCLAREGLALRKR